MFTHTLITYLVTGHNLDEAAVRRAIELSATKYCPAQAMLGKVVPMELRYEIYEGESAESATVKTGTYTPSRTITIGKSNSNGNCSLAIRQFISRP